MPNEILEIIFESGIFCLAKYFSILLEEIAGHDERDSTSSNVKIPNYSKKLNQDISGKTIGIPKEYTVDGISNEINTVWEDAIKSLESYHGLLKTVAG